jgi:hypothetical protein
VADGINNVRELFPKMLFDESLVGYVNKISEYSPKLNKEGLPTDSAIHCDVSDTIRYMATAYIDVVEVENEWDIVEMDYSNYI